MMLKENDSYIKRCIFRLGELSWLFIFGVAWVWCVIEDEIWTPVYWWVKKKFTPPRCAACESKLTPYIHLSKNGKRFCVDCFNLILKEDGRKELVL